MKKWLKIWVAALAIMATAATLVSTWNVKAENANNEVKVIIGQYNEWRSECSWENYELSFTASSQQQVKTDTWNVNCIFGNKIDGAVQIQLSWDLVYSWDSNIYIPRANVKLKNGTWSATPADLWAGVTTNTSSFVNFHENLGTSLFNKNLNKIGDASWTNIEIEVTVPAWQPDGTYNGILVLSYPWA